ncbi:MAG: Hsp20/alpha crystallin family protein [Halobacteriaceae archaeon]
MTSRRNPFKEIENVLDRMGNQFDLEHSFRPPVDVEDRGDEFVVTAELPGYDQDDITVELVGDTLRIDAEYTSETEEMTDRYVREERHKESLHRSVSLPEDVNEEGVSAEFENGVLTVTLPKASAPDEGHHISIE